MGNSIGFSGLGSGIDFDLIRNAIISSRSRSVSLLQNKINDYSGRIDALKTLNTGLAGLISTSEALVNRDLGFERSTTTSDATIATASAEANTAVGTYDLDITRLASNLTQTSRSYASEDDTVLVGASTTATFELRLGGASEGTEITIDENNNTLAGLRDAINAADAGVNATIIDVTGDGTGNQLVLTSEETGSAGRVELVETSATGTEADLAITSVNPVSGDFSELDAQFSINGLDITRGSNVVDDAVSGVTLTLKETGSTTVSVVEGTDIQNRLLNFINQYNKIQDFVEEQYATDDIGRPTGALAGDTTFRSVQQQLRNTLRTVSEDNGGALTTLADIGVNVLEDGRLELDAAVLNERLDANPSDVQALLYGATENDTGIFHAFETTANALGDDITGSVQVAIDGYQTSIESTNATIESRLQYIEQLNQSLIRQFAAADAAIGQLNGQGAALNGIIDSLNSNNDN